MDREELGRLYPIIVKPYNPEWKTCYHQEKECLLNLFSGELRIEHIGSTAVVGIAAKPTIDILVEKPASLSDSQIIAAFERAGYIHMKEQANHLMFVKGYTPTGLEDISYHIHMGPLDQSWLWDRVYFRDYLNQMDGVRKEYQDLKIELAEKYRNDREAYTDSKADFIIRITEEAGNALQ